jgi:putative acetyltransferase
MLRQARPRGRGMIEISNDELSSDAAAALISALNAELSGQYPEPGSTHFRLDHDEVGQGLGAFFVARLDGEPVGCGAVRRLDDETAEIKRMYVVPAMRGKGIAHRLLATLEAEARRLGVKRLVLETGDRLPAAMALYTRAGFVRIPPFGEYIGSPLSVCMARTLG